MKWASSPCLACVDSYYKCSNYAIDQGVKLGAGLLQDAVRRVLVVSENAGVRALLVHAIDERAKQFYEHYGFQASPLHPMTLMLRLAKSSRLLI